VADLPIIQLNAQFAEIKLRDERIIGADGLFRADVLFHTRREELTLLAHASDVRHSKTPQPSDRTVIIRSARELRHSLKL
jgi:hypothetical protein